MASHCHVYSETYIMISPHEHARHRPTCAHTEWSFGHKNIPHFKRKPKDLATSDSYMLNYL